MDDSKRLAEALKYFAQTQGGAVTGMAPRDDVRRGELGTLYDPQGRMNTELSITVDDPRLLGGRPTNIPLLVMGQKNLQALQGMNRPTDEQYDISVQRAVERVKAGGYLPSYESVDAAVKAAESRPVSKKQPYYRQPELSPESTDTSNLIDDAVKWLRGLGQ